MLTDTKLKTLKPKEKTYKVVDRDGMYVTVSPAGAITFRYDYRLNGRRETLTLGRYDSTLPGKGTRNLASLEFGTSLSLAETRMLLMEAKRLVEAGISPARTKAEKRTVASESLTFEEWTQKYFEFKSDPKSGSEQLADSTLEMRKSTYKRVLAGKLGKLKLDEITPLRLKALLDDLKEKRGPAVALHAREIVLNIFRHARGCGLKTVNPAEEVRASSIATMKPRERALSPEEIRVFFLALEQVATMPTLRLAIKFILLTGVRKSEFIGATWDEIDFKNDRWVIPSKRMKAGRDHVVYLADQAMDILTVFRTCFRCSRYLHPSRYDSDTPISNATLNRVITAAVMRIIKTDPDFQSFGVHDLRRTFSTCLNRAKFDERWIEMALAHAPKNRIAAIYNVSRYSAERRIMTQCWANMIDCWLKGTSARDVITEARKMAFEVLDLEISEDL
ncbi:MAG: tyrosine-type recombinase/integrase [Betaproteobacteria bacterium]|nr:tyrosine-type recombinase/integrase [Betaproteobacteria bacterium]